MLPDSDKTGRVFGYFGRQPRLRPCFAHTLAAASAIVALAASCSGGEIGEPIPGLDGNPAVPGGPAAPGAAGGGAVGPTMPGAGGPSVTPTDPSPPGDPSTCTEGRLEPRAVLVAPRQYVNLLRDLVGPMAVSESDAAASSELLVETIDRPRMTTATLDRFVRLAESATATLRGRAATFFACPNLRDEACVRTALGRIARRAYKRPLDSDELQALMALRQEGLAAVSDDQGETAALAALQAVLISPSAMYRTEFQSPAQGGQRKLSPHERAAALAAFLLDSVPDEALLAAAEDGSLATAAGIQAQVDRLLALPRVREHLTQVVLTAYNVPRIFNTPKDPALFPNYTAQLQNSMYEETRRFVDDVLWTRKAPIGELMTSRRSFVDGPLAQLYGLPPVRGSQFQAVELPPERAGLLTQASVMSVLSRTDKTSVVARGLFVRGNVLCLPKIPGPPMSVQAQVAMQLDAKSSQKELAEYRAMTSPCSSCHQQFDRFGLLLEAFDATGKYLPQAAEAIDFSGLSPFDGVLDGLPALSERMSEEQLFEACFSDRALSYALTIATESAELCLRAADGGVPSSATMRDLVLAVAQSPAFNDRTEVEP